MCLNVDFDAYGNVIQRPPTTEEILVQVVSASIVILLLSVVVYSIWSIVRGSYGLLTIKDKTKHTSNKRDLRKGLIMFVVTFLAWSLINLTSAFLGVDTLCF